VKIVVTPAVANLPIVVLSRRLYKLPCRQPGTCLKNYLTPRTLIGENSCDASGGKPANRGAVTPSVQTTLPSARDLSE